MPFQTVQRNLTGMLDLSSWPTQARRSQKAVM
jgi:hypothetical protein